MRKIYFLSIAGGPPQQLTAQPDVMLAATNASHTQFIYASRTGLYVAATGTTTQLIQSRTIRHLAWRN